MRTARYLPTCWWLDPEFLRLAADAQRALGCLWHSPETPLCGITTVSASTIADRLRITSKVAASRLAELEATGFVSIDREATLIWLHTYLETQLGGMPSTNAKWVTNTVNALNTLPDTALTRRFRANYELPDRVSIRPRYPIDRVSMPPAMPPLLPVPSSPSLGVPGGEERK